MCDSNNNNGRQDAINDSALSNKTINLSFALTRNDLFWYNIHFARLPMLGFFVFLFLFIAGFILAIQTPKGDLQTAFIWTEIGLGIGLSICMGTISAIVLQIYFLKSTTVTRAMSERNYIISSAGIAVSDERNRLNRTWQEVRNVIKTRKGFYFRTGDKLAIIIPRHVFKDRNDLKAFEEILNKHAD
jgi:hypothetical protein